MEPQTEQHRRSRKRAQPTTGTITKTMQDALGFAEPISRYGELPTCLLIDLYNAINGNSRKSEYPKARLTRHFQEAAGLPSSQKILIRPEYQWRHGINHQTIYRKTSGSNRLLHAKDIYDAIVLRFANTTQIVQLTDDEHQPPSDHDAGLSVIVASLEIAARRTSGIQYLTHIDVLKNASEEAQAASSPLSIPVPDFTHAFPRGTKAHVKNAHVKPDALFGLRYAEPDWKFCAVEYDRSSEDMEPTSNLQRASWLRKDLFYSAISRRPNPIYKTYLKIPNLLVLCIFQDVRRMQHAQRLVKQYAAYPSQFLFKVVPPLDPLVDANPILTLFTEPWQRAGAPPFSLMTGKEVM